MTWELAVFYDYPIWVSAGVILFYRGTFLSFCQRGFSLSFGGFYGCKLGWVRARICPGRWCESRLFLHVAVVGWDLLIGSLFTHAIMRAWRADFSILNSMMAFIWRALPVRPLLIARSIGDPSSEFVPSASRRVYRWLGLVAMRCRWVLFMPGNGVGDLNGFWHCHPPALALSL